jgi:hypothetical protein
MRSIFLFFNLAFSVHFLNAQKFALLENKGENTHYFDYSNPNSFVGVLMNNIDYIPTLVDQNSYEGVYDDFMLMQLGVPTEQMLSLTTSKRILLYEPQTNEEIICIKTTQSLDAFLDSVKDIPIYQDLLLIEKERLQLYWNNSCENCALRSFSKFYFDIRNTDALLIEDRENERWIHLIGKLKDGRHMITLSLRAEQLKEEECFRFLHFIDPENSKSLYEAYKKQANYQIESAICRDWKQGKSIFFSALLNNFDVINVPACWNYITASGLQLMGVSDSEKIGTLHQPIGKDTISTTFELVQQRGEIFFVYNYLSEDTTYIIKTPLDFKTAYRSFMDNPDFVDYIYSDSTWLASWWASAQIGDTLRALPQSLTFWKERNQNDAAFYYKIGTDLNNIPQAFVTDLVFYSSQPNSKEIFLSYNYQTARDNEEFNGAILKEINMAIQKQEAFLNSLLRWNNFLGTSTKKMAFPHLQKKLNLINTNPEI